MLRYYAALPDREIAEHLSCAEPTVRSLASRAFARLRQQPQLAELAPPHTPTAAKRSPEMDRLEALVRDTLAEHAESAPITLPTRTAHRPRRTWWAAAAAAAAVALVAGLAALQSSRDSARPAGSGPQPTGPTGARITSSVPGVPAGYKLVSYRGIEFTVPNSLTVTHSPCEPPVNAVYAPNGAAYSCPAAAPNSSEPLPATATAVWLDRTPDAPVATTHEPTGHRTVAGVEVTATAPTQAQVDTILTSIRTITVDHRGCLAHPASITPTGQPAAVQLVPSGATSAVACELSPIGTNHSYWLVGSYQLGAGTVARLAAALDALPTGTGKSGVDLPQYVWVRFGYAAGETRVVAIPTDIAPAYVSDGHRTAVDHNPGIDIIPLLRQD